MKILVSFGLSSLLILSATAQEKPGIHFEDHPDWRQMKVKAASEGKMLFLACPSGNDNEDELINESLLQQQRVGAYFNSHFVSVKSRIDAAEISKGIEAGIEFGRVRDAIKGCQHPVYVFLDASGQLVHAFSGVMPAGEFLDQAANSLDTAKQYFRLLSRYESKQKDYAVMPYMIAMASSLNERSLAEGLTTDYLRGHLYQLPRNSWLTKTNINLVRTYVKTVEDPGFLFFKDDESAIDSVMNNKGFASGMVDFVIENDLLAWLVRQRGQAMAATHAWDSLEEQLRTRFGPVIARRVMLEQKIKWYTAKRDWRQVANYAVYKTEQYGYDTSAYGKMALNSLLYDVIFKYSDDKDQLSKAIQWMQQLLATSPDAPEWLDTYANLLYKTGHPQKAIEIEEKAANSLPDNEEIAGTLLKMKRNEPTWPTIDVGASAPLVTAWAKDVNPLEPLPEYPRPQMVRKFWHNLNGQWDYAITDSNSAPPTSFEGKILVPYPVESYLSGVGRPLLPNQRLWYRRDFQIVGKKSRRRYLLHFGAVDFECRVYINGRVVGGHRGGYQQFDLDISDAAREGDNELLVSVTDPTDRGDNPKGKQSLNPNGLMYTASSGIWQTVWMEEVPDRYIDHLRLTPRVDQRDVSIFVETGDCQECSIEASSGGRVAYGQVNTEVVLSVPNARLWSPSDPFLYELSVKLLYKGKVIDEVSSYFGMRKIEVKKDSAGVERIFLNNRYTFNLGVLDQGFWPDGLYTAPTDSALEWDIRAIKSMGFNTIRKHIKIEPARWYYHCDKLGILVWQDMPYPARLTDVAKAEFEAENKENIAQLYNHPSIVCWVLFNEGWNRFDQRRLAGWLKQADPTRITDAHSGENYDRGTAPSLKWTGSDLVDMHSYPGPDIPSALPGKARVLGEWGGIRVAIRGHEWNPSEGWGYAESTADDFKNKYIFFIKHLRLYEEEGLSASIYTQPFDVEGEENGLISYDRKVFKISPAELRIINAMVLPSR